MFSIEPSNFSSICGHTSNSATPLPPCHLLSFCENKKKLAEGQFFFKQIGIFRKKGFPYEKFPY
jgi:hypothetical protein